MEPSKIGTAITPQHRLISESPGASWFLREARSLASYPNRIYLVRSLRKWWNEKSPMVDLEKARLAEEVMDLWCSFQVSLSDKRQYPAAEFTSFARSARRYIQAVA